MATLTYYGHSCFSLHWEDCTLLFDPFISGNELAKNIDLESISADYILLSHGHADHLLDCEALALRTGATVICSWEIHEWLHNKSVTNTHPMNTGGSWTFDEFTVKCVVAHHSSGLPDGSYGGSPMGFIIFKEGSSYYYSGDTSLTLDMQLIPLWAKLNAAILPIGNNFTMDYEDACRAADFIQCNKIVGVHYNTFGFIKIDQQEVLAHFSENNKQLLLPEIGEQISL